MKVFAQVRTYVVSLVVGAIAHWAAVHPGAIDPFYTGTVVGVILHALHMDAGSSAGTGTLPSGSA